MAASMGLGPSCDAKLTKEENSILIEGVRLGFSDFVTTLTLRVHEDGTVETVSSDPPLEDANIACPAVGCSDAVILASDLEGSFDEFRASTFQVCVNDDCQSSPLSILGGVPSSSEDVFPQLTPAGNKLVDLRLGTQDDIHLWLQASFFKRPISAGDFYSVRVTDAHGRDTMNMKQTIAERPAPPPPGRCGPWACVTVRQDTRVDPDPWSL